MHGLKQSPRDILAARPVKFVQAKSMEFFRSARQKFDFIFLDGDHSNDIVIQEVKAALKVVSPDAVIVLHDYFPDLKPLWRDGSVIYGPSLAMKKFKNIPLGELPWPTNWIERYPSRYCC